jgi:hypothetical protein
VCLAKEDNAGALLETGLILRGAKIKLEDVSRDSIIVAFSGVPHDVPDSSVARVVAGFGTVTGEWRPIVCPLSFHKERHHAVCVFLLIQILKHLADIHETSYGHFATERISNAVPYDNLQLTNNNMAEGLACFLIWKNSCIYKNGLVNAYP